MTKGKPKPAPKKAVKEGKKVTPLEKELADRAPKEPKKP